jgi:hypothetical protein
LIEDEAREAKVLHAPKRVRSISAARGSDVHVRFGGRHSAGVPCSSVAQMTGHRVLACDDANGVKHPFAGYADIATGQIRRVEWEDIDFWTTADFGAPTLFINDKKGTPRSVEAVVGDFCREYLANEAAGIHVTETAAPRLGPFASVDGHT